MWNGRFVSSPLGEGREPDRTHLAQIAAHVGKKFLISWVGSRKFLPSPSFSPKEGDRPGRKRNAPTSTGSPRVGMQEKKEVVRMDAAIKVAGECSVPLSPISSLHQDPMRPYPIF